MPSSTLESGIDGFSSAGSSRPSHRYDFAFIRGHQIVQRARDWAALWAVIGWLVLQVAAVVGLALAMSFFGTGCAHPIHPLSPGDVPCRTDFDCAESGYCGFRGIDTHPICRP